MSNLANEINQAAADKLAADAKAQAERQAIVSAPPVAIINIRNTRPKPLQGSTPAGDLVFPDSMCGPKGGFTLKAGDNLIDVDRVTELVRQQLAEWILCGWVEVVAAEVST